MKENLLQAGGVIYTWMSARHERVGSFDVQEVKFITISPSNFGRREDSGHTLTWCKILGKYV